MRGFGDWEAGREGGLEVGMGQPGRDHLRGRSRRNGRGRMEEGRNEKGRGKRGGTGGRIAVAHTTCLQVTLRSGKQLWMCWW